MPLPMVHLSVARNIADLGFGFGNLSQFYLGSISPDAIHMRPNADKDAKRKTHLTPIGQRRIHVSESDFVKFLPEFIMKNQSKTDVDFLWGYCLHIFTDLYWIKYVYHKFVEDYTKDPSPVQNLSRAYYNDTEILDQVLFNECNWKDNVLKHLQEAEVSNFLDLLSAQEICLWKSRTLNLLESSDSKFKQPIRYITKLDVENFISKCTETIRRDIIFTL